MLQQQPLWHLLKVLWKQGCAIIGHDMPFITLLWLLLHLQRCLHGHVCCMHLTCVIECMLRP